MVTTHVGRLAVAFRKELEVVSLRAERSVTTIMQAKYAATTKEGRCGDKRIFLSFSSGLDRAARVIHYD
jgi:hypothetical protein